MYRADCRAASVFLSIYLIWSFMLFFVFNVSPRYLYVSLGSMVMSPSLMVGLVLSLPIMRSLDFSWPNWILYLLAVLFVIDSRVC